MFHYGSAKLAGANLLWKTWAPPRVKFFMLLALHWRLRTPQALWPAGRQCMCVMRQSHELIDHLLLHCPVAKQIWWDALNWLGLANQFVVNNRSIAGTWGTMRVGLPKTQRKGIDTRKVECTPKGIYHATCIHSIGCCLEFAQPTRKHLRAEYQLVSEEYVLTRVEPTYSRKRFSPCRGIGYQLRSSTAAPRPPSCSRRRRHGRPPCEKHLSPFPTATLLLCSNPQFALAVKFQFCIWALVCFNSVP